MPLPPTLPAPVLAWLARTGLLRFAPVGRVRQWVASSSQWQGKGQLTSQINATHGAGVAKPLRQLLVDVSVIHWHDAGTGIQRVVRSVLAHLQAHPPEGFVVRSVVAESKRPYHYADVPGQPGQQQVKVQRGDIFLGLDLAAHLLPRHISQLLQWKLDGANLHFVVYDMLPLTHPSQFTAARVRHFQRWARLIAIMADSLLCISQTVQRELQHWLSQNTGLSPAQLPSHVIPLGGDFLGATSSTTGQASTQVLQTLKQLQTTPTVLMVGTLEPRKCHAQVLSAFEHLWAQQNPAALLLVGRPGWHTEPLQQRITQHEQLNHKLFWFNAANDAELELFYKQATGVVAASLAEGYGLPLSEALNHGKPLLARDISVFREVAGEYAQYFTADAPEALARTLQQWLACLQPVSAASIPQHPVQTWSEATRQILQVLGIPLVCGQTSSKVQSA